MIIDRMEKAGLALSVSPDGKLGVAGEITDAQRSYIKQYKQQLILALRLRPLAIRRRFGDLLEQIAFSTRIDLDRAAAMNDAELEYCALEIMVEVTGTPVQCRDCDHFQRTEHPHLGRCLKKVPPPNCGMWWDSTVHCCRQLTRRKV